MNWSGFLNEAFYGSIDNIILMASIIIPIMIILEVLRDLKVLDRLGEWMGPSLKIFGMSKEAAPPIMVGLGFGITYGAGVIIEAARSGRLTWKDLFLINLFLSICHSVVEDTALFMAVGANGIAILAGRFILGIIVIYLVSRSSWLARQAEIHSLKDSSGSWKEVENNDRCC